MRHATEATDQQAFFENDGDFSAEAARRFPFSAQNGRIRGTGRFVLLSKCRTPWRIFCFTTAERRAEYVDTWQRTGCGDPRCTFDHTTENL